MINEEGIDNCIKRHQEVAFKFLQEIKNWARTISQERKLVFEYSNLTSINNPKGISPENIIKALLESYNIRVTDGLGEFKGEMIRVGHMGYQADHLKAMKIIHALKEIIG